MSEATIRKFLELQTLFDSFNKDGSTMQLSGGGHDPVSLGIVDSYTVMQVDGNQFWLHFKMLGYHHGFQHAHTVKIISWTQDDTYLLDLIDDQDRRFHIELIFPELEEDLGGAWQTWQAYKRANRKRFERIDAQMLEEHKRIVETWDK